MRFYLSWLILTKNKTWLQNQISNFRSREATQIKSIFKKMNLHFFWWFKIWSPWNRKPIFFFKFIRSTPSHSVFQNLNHASSAFYHLFKFSTSNSCFQIYFKMWKFHLLKGSEHAFKTENQFYCYWSSIISSEAVDLISCTFWTDICIQFCLL